MHWFWTCIDKSAITIKLQLISWQPKPGSKIMEPPRKLDLSCWDACISYLLLCVNGSNSDNVRTVAGIPTSQGWNGLKLAGPDKPDIDQISARGEMIHNQEMIRRRSHNCLLTYGSIFPWHLANCPRVAELNTAIPTNQTHKSIYLRR